MKKTKLVVFLLLGLILFNINGLEVLSGNKGDIVVMEYNQSERNITSGEKFTFTMTCKKFVDAEINDIYVTIDNSSAFYIAKDQPQVIKIGNMADDKPKSVNIDLVYKGTGKELILQFSYKKEGASCEASSIVYIDTYEKDNTKTVVDTAKQKPSIKIIGDASIPIGEAGNNVDLELPVKNVGSFKAKNVIATIVSDSNLFSYTASKINLSNLISEISPNKTEKLKFNLDVSPYAESGNYTIKVNFEYTNEAGDSFTSSENVFMKIENNNTKPFLILKNVLLNPERPSPGENINVLFEFENLGTFDAKDVKVKVEGFKEDGIIPKFTGSKYLESIEGGKCKTAFVELGVSEDIKTKSYQIKVIVEYKDSQKNTYNNEFIYYIPINISKESNIAALKIENLNISSKKVSPNEEFEISFDIENSGTLKSTNAKVWVSSDAEIVSKSVSTIVINSIEKGEKKSFGFVMEALDKAISKNYPIAINVEYEEEKGANKQTLTQYAGVLVANESSKDIEENKSVPKLIIDSYTITPQKAFVGEEFKVDVNILNTHKNKDVSNIKLSLTGQDGELLPGKGNSGSIYIEGIKAHSAVCKSIAFVTKLDAQPKTYFLNVDFEYEDNKGNPYTSKGLLSIPVVQKSGITVSEVNIAGEASINQSVPVSVEFYNTGKSTIKNLFVNCKGDFEIQGSNYFVGNFESGTSDYYEAVIVPKKEGLSNGRIVLTYEDSNGEKIEFEKEFCIDIKNKLKDNISKEGNAIEQGRGKDDKAFSESSFLFLLTIPFVLVIISIPLFKVIKKRKKESTNLYEDL